MFGIKFIKVQPTTHVLQYRGGKVVREGSVIFGRSLRELAGRRSA